LLRGNGVYRLLLNRQRHGLSMCARCVLLRGFKVSMVNDSVFHWQYGPHRKRCCQAYALSAHLFNNSQHRVQFEQPITGQIYLQTYKLEDFFIFIMNHYQVLWCHWRYRIHVNI
jgi:hypothetical protein